MFDDHENAKKNIVQTPKHTLWRLRCLLPLEVFFLNIGATDLNFSTHNQFGLKFKFTKFSMDLVAMVTKKQDGRHGFNAFSQQRYLKKL